MSTDKARRLKLAGAVAAVVVAGAALGVIVAVLTAKPDVVNEVALDKMTEIERLAPLDTHQLVLTPGLGEHNEWWNTVVALMPGAVALDNLKPTADLGITHLGYSASAADPALNLDKAYARMLYVETDSDEHARKVQGWLSSSIGAATGAVSTTIQGHTVVLGPSDVGLVAELAKGGTGLGSTAGYRQDTAVRDPGSLFWEDWEAYVKAAGASGGKPDEYSRFFQAATGFTKDSRWVGYSTSPQAGWSGEFRSGGLDPKLVSLANVSRAIAAFDTVLSKDWQGKPVATDSGAGNFLSDSFYVVHPGLKAPQEAIGSATLAFKTKSAGDTAFSFEPARWRAGTSRVGAGSPEGASLFAYSISGNQINLKVTIDEEMKTANRSTPVETFAPPILHPADSEPYAGDIYPLPTPAASK